VQAEAARRLQEAVEKAESIPPPDLRDLFTWTYAEMSPHLKEQYDESARSLGGN